MKKLLTVAIVIILSILFGNGCTLPFNDFRTKNPSASDQSASTNESYSTSTNSSNSNNNQKEKDLKDYQVYINLSDIINEVSKEPVWSFETFPLIADFRNFCYTMYIPGSITKAFDNCVNRRYNSDYDRTEVEFILKDNPSTKLIGYQKDKAFHLSTSYDKNAKLIGQGIFKNGDNLVLISVCEVPENVNEQYPIEHIVFCRKEIGKSGVVSYTEELMDTLFLEDKNFKRVLVRPECTILYYPATAEFLCVKDSKPVGQKTKAPFDLYCESTYEFKSSISIFIANCDYKKVLDKNKPYDEWKVMYPVLLNNENQFSFHILNTEMKLGNVIENKSVKLNNFKYPIFKEYSDQKTFYLPNAAPSNLFLNGSSKYTDKTPFSNFYDLLIVNDSEVFFERFCYT